MRSPTMLRYSYRSRPTLYTFREERFALPDRTTPKKLRANKYESWGVDVEGVI